MAHKYFNRKPDDWNITDFLNECEVESFRDKVGCYLTSLEKIIKTEKDERCERAKLLYDRYKKDAQPDYHLSRKWKNKREQASDTGVPSVRFNNPIFTGNPLVGNSGNINGGTFVNESKRNMLEREHEKVKTSRKTTLLDEDVEQEEYDVKSTKKKSTRKRKSICYTESSEEDHTSDPDYMEKPKRKQESRSKRLREKASCDDTDKGGIIVETSKDTNTSSPARSTVTPNTPRQSLTSLDTSEDFVTSRESTPCPTVHSATSTLIVTPNEYSDATKETITKQIEKDLFDESHVKIEDFESVTVGQKRPYEEGVPSTPSQKIRSVTFNDEESTVPPTPLIDTQNDDVFNKVSHEVYIKIRQDVRDRPSQKDWFIGECNVSNAFRNFQITNIDKLESGDTFFFSLNVEEILSLHHIMLVDLTRMKKPSYVITDERNWRASVRQPSQPDPAEFFGNIMNEYEKVINDIDELRLKFYEMWGKYCDKVIYSDEERRLFETTQIVTRVFYERMHMYPDSGEDENEDTVMHEYIHDTFKETFRDSNYDTVWANSESLSSKDYRSTYGRSQGKKTDLTIYRIIEKGKRKESCFVEVKPFKITRTSKVGGYNLYKVAIFCQGGINNILLCENESGVQTFGGHICEGYIYYCMMDLEYDGIYRFFQLSEIKLARKLSEFNLVRKLILETYLFKRRIDSYYSNRNNYSSSLCSSRFIRNPTVTPKAPKNAIPDVSLKKQKPTKKRRSV